MVCLTATSPLSPLILVPPPTKRPIPTPHPSLNGFFPYHPWRINDDSSTLRCVALTSPKRRSVRTQGSLSPRTFATRLRSLTPHRTRYLCLSFSLFIHPPCISFSLCLFLHFFPFFPLGGRRTKLVTGEARVVTVHRSTSTEVLP